MADLTPTHLALLQIINFERRMPTATEFEMFAYELQKAGLVQGGGCCGASPTEAGLRVLAEERAANTARD